jgi:hypothetical protein
MTCNAKRPNAGAEGAVAHEEHRRTVPVQSLLDTLIAGGACDRDPCRRWAEIHRDAVARPRVPLARLRDRHARFARPEKGPAARRAVTSGGGVARSSSAGRPATNAGSGATALFRRPRMKASSVACVFSEAAARGALGLAIQGVGACRAGKGGGVSGISAQSSGGRGGGRRGAFANAACIFARAITASQSWSCSVGAAARRKRAATRCSGRLAMVSSRHGVWGCRPLMYGRRNQPPERAHVVRATAADYSRARRPTPRRSGDELRLDAAAAAAANHRPRWRSVCRRARRRWICCSRRWRRRREQANRHRPCARG